MVIKMSMKTEDDHEIAIERMISEDSLRMMKFPIGPVRVELSAMFEHFYSQVLAWVETYK